MTRPKSGLRTGKTPAPRRMEEEAEPGHSSRAR
jgi:hypothetical protein